MTARVSERRGASRAAGFTIVELLTVLVIVAVLAVLAGPSLINAMVTQRLRAAGTDLVSSLMYARSEAIKRNANVEVRPQGGDWTKGWTVVSAGGAQIDRRDALGHRVQVSRAPDSVVFNPAGRLDAAGNARFELVDPDSGPSNTPRCVTVDTGGYAKLAATTCP